MKFNPIILLLLIFPLISNGQDYSKENPEPESWPFGQIGDTSRGVFNTDDRIEATDAHEFKDYVRATAVMVSNENIEGNKVYGWSLRERLKMIYKTDKFDDNVKFLDQPTCGSCTGFLIAPDILVTAGHCIETMEKANKYTWVFDYTADRSHNSTGRYVTIPTRDQYKVKEIITAKFGSLSTMTDYSVLRLERKSDRDPYRFRTSGKVAKYQNVNMIGSPTGLPLKMTDNAYVTNNDYSKWFQNDLDGFPGNSGGPVFNKYGFIEGIHVRGAVELNQSKKRGDYIYDESCKCIKTLEFKDTKDNAGSHAHRILSMPNEVLQMALYENIVYAIEQDNRKRLGQWLAYQWMVEHEYTQERGRLEFVAIKAGNLDALQKIIKITGSKDFIDKDGQGALHYAAKANKSSIMAYLLKAGFSPNRKDNDGKTALMVAIENNSVSAAKAILSKDSKVDAKDELGNTALHYAAKSGNLDLAKAVALKSKYPRQTNNAGLTARKMAKKAKFKALSRMLKLAEKGKL